MEERIKINLKFNDKKITINSPNVVIPVGGVTPSGTLEISQNGEHNVKYYEFANVNVPIPEGYLKPEGMLSIVENGTYSVIPFESVMVDVPIPEGYIVPSGSIDITDTEEVDVTQFSKAKIADDNLKAENIAENVTVLGITGTFRGGIDTSDGDVTAGDILAGKVAYAKEERIVGTIETYDYSNSEDVSPEIDKLISRELTSIHNDRVTTIGANAFYDYSTLESVNFPNVVTVNVGAFQSCTNLKSIVLPKATGPFGTGNNGAFHNSGIEYISLPSVTTLAYRVFYTTSYLHTIHLPNLKSITGQAFYKCYGLKKVIIEQTESVCTLSNTTAFNNCYHILGEVNATFNPEGLADGYIYVPDELVEQYKVATNWSTFASQIKPLSELEVE